MSAVSKSKSQSTWEHIDRGIVRTKTYEDGREKVTSYSIGKILGSSLSFKVIGLNPKKEGKSLAIKVIKTSPSSRSPFHQREGLSREYQILLLVEEKCPSFKGYFKGFIPQSKTHEPTLIIRKMNSTWEDREPDNIITRIFALRDLANQLKELHSNGISHMDTRDHNIMYHKVKEKYFIIDFGSSLTKSLLERFEYDAATLARIRDLNMELDDYDLEAYPTTSVRPSLGHSFEDHCKRDILELIQSTKPHVDPLLSPNPKIMTLWDIEHAPNTIDEFLEKIQEVIDYIG
ncbi:MAG: serine/threonine-protein kinase [Rhabdochlamydiaceae bacterium]|nr:serine/threonine-protein kinase [Rhabdochlamydiaceae bacterium]